jgi:hypothetical protein
MKLADPIEELTRKYLTQRNADFKTPGELDRRILTDALEAQERCTPPRRALWRSPVLRLAALPAGAFVVLLALVLVSHLSTPAWAIDQTIQVLRSVKAIHLSGFCVQPGQPKRDFEIWARPSSNNPAMSGDFRLREGNVHLSIASEAENTTAVIETRPPDQGGSVVYLTDGLNRSTRMQADRWFEDLKQNAKDWTEELRHDPQTGRRLAVVTCEGPSVNTAKFWEFQFDAETKLPVRARVWFTSNRQGEPHWDIVQFACNPVLPDDAFKITLPEQAQVVDCRVLRNVMAEKQNAEAGLVVGETDLHKACRAVAEAYWNAVCRQDWEEVRRLRPLADGDALEQLKTDYRKREPVALTRILFTEHVSDPGAFAEVTCLVRLKEGREVRSILNVAAKPIPNGTAAVVAGTLGPELAE